MPSLGLSKTRLTAQHRSLPDDALMVVGAELGHKGAVNYGISSNWAISPFKRFLRYSMTTTGAYLKLACVMQMIQLNAQTAASIVAKPAATKWRGAMVPSSRHPTTNHSVSARR